MTAPGVFYCSLQLRNERGHVFLLGLTRIVYESGHQLFLGVVSELHHYEPWTVLYLVDSAGFLLEHCDITTSCLQS